MKHAKDEETERLKVEKRKTELLTATQINLEMAQRKKKIEDDLRERDVNARRVSEQLYRDSLEDDRQKKMAKMKKMEELKLVLDQQCESKRKAVKNAQILTAEERMLNKVWYMAYGYDIYIALLLYCCIMFGVTVII